MIVLVSSIVMLGELRVPMAYYMPQMCGTSAKIIQLNE